MVDMGRTWNIYFSKEETVQVHWLQIMLERSFLSSIPACSDNVQLSSFV